MNSGVPNDVPSTFKPWQSVGNAESPTHTGSSGLVYSGRIPLGTRLVPHFSFTQVQLYTNAVSELFPKCVAERPDPFWFAQYVHVVQEGEQVFTFS